MRRTRIGKQARVGKEWSKRAISSQRGKKGKAKRDPMTLAILFAFASALLLSLGLVTTQFGLRDVEPFTGASISVPSFTSSDRSLSPKPATAIEIL